MVKNYKSKSENNREDRFKQNQRDFERKKYDNSNLIKTAVIATGAVTLDLLTQKAYANGGGSQTDGFEDGTWNANNMFTLLEGNLSDSNEFSGYLHLQKDTGEIVDRIATEEYPGEQTLTAKFSNTIPDNFRNYGIKIANLANTDGANLTVFNWSNTLYFLFEDEVGSITWQEITQTGPFYLKLEKNSSNVVQAYISEDGVIYTQIPGVTEVPSNTIGGIVATYIDSSTTIHEAQEFNFSGPQVPNKNNEASQTPLGLDLGILTSTLLAYGIIKLKRKFSK